MFTPLAETGSFSRGDLGEVAIICQSQVDCIPRVPDIPINCDDIFANSVANFLSITKVTQTSIIRSGYNNVSQGILDLAPGKTNSTAAVFDYTSIRRESQLIIYQLHATSDTSAGAEIDRNKIPKRSLGYRSRFLGRSSLREAPRRFIYHSGEFARTADALPW